MDPVTFVFLLTMWTESEPMANVYVEDVNLSAADCTAAMEEYNRNYPAWDKGIPSCEIDVGILEESLSHEYAVEHDGEYLFFLPCETEDSDNCVWDARHRGNGTGQSFYNLNGNIYPVVLDD